MTVATWIAILVLGPGSVAVFAFFLRDLRQVMGDRRSAGVRKGETEVRGPR